MNIQEIPFVSTAVLIGFEKPNPLFNLPQLGAAVETKGSWTIKIIWGRIPCDLLLYLLSIMYHFFV